MRLSFSLYDPTGNITLLVETPTPPEAQPDIAARLMALEPEAEQVGFLSGDASAPALRMAGGEFCGNASMSAAAFFAQRAGLSEARLSLAVSGTDAPVPVAVRALPDGGFFGAVEMPRPLSVTQESLPDGGALPVVRFPGIAHAIVEETPDTRRAQTLAPIWCRALHADALGLMFLDRARGTLTPLVYVPAAGTLVWESSCASGTSAVGAYLSDAAGAPVTLALRQPGGTLTVEAAPGGAPTLSGTVRLIKRAEAEL